jgi:hypothetical protein
MAHQLRRTKEAELPDGFRAKLQGKLAYLSMLNAEQGGTLRALVASSKGAV